MFYLDYFFNFLGKGAKLQIEFAGIYWEKSASKLKCNRIWRLLTQKENLVCLEKDQIQK